MIRPKEEKVDDNDASSSGFQNSFQYVDKMPIGKVKQYLMANNIEVSNVLTNTDNDSKLNSDVNDETVRGEGGLTDEDISLHKEMRNKMKAHFLASVVGNENAILSTFLYGSGLHRYNFNKKRKFLQFDPKTKVENIQKKSLVEATDKAIYSLFQKRNGPNDPIKSTDGNRTANNNYNIIGPPSYGVHARSVSSTSFRSIDDNGNTVPYGNSFINDYPEVDDVTQKLQHSQKCFDDLLKIQSRHERLNNSLSRKELSLNIALPNEHVAAKMYDSKLNSDSLQEDEDNSVGWVLAKVIDFSFESLTYQLVDIDAEAEANANGVNESNNQEEEEEGPSNHGNESGAKKRGRKKKINVNDTQKPTSKKTSKEKSSKNKNSSQQKVPIVRLPISKVIRLDYNVHELERGNAVLAVFPDTTCFYKATVAKLPKTPSLLSSSNTSVGGTGANTPVTHIYNKDTLNRHSLPTNPNRIGGSESIVNGDLSSHLSGLIATNGTPGNHTYQASLTPTVAVRFDDDCDATGWTPLRKVPGHHIIKLPGNSTLYDDEYDDSDYEPLPPMRPTSKDLEKMKFHKSAVSDEDQKCSSPLDKFAEWEVLVNRIERKRHSRDYRGMIKCVLPMYPQGEATLKEIYDSIEEFFSGDLQWKFDPDSRRAPVWKAKVRNVLLGIDSKPDKKPFESFIRNNTVYFKVA